MIKKTTLIAAFLFIGLVITDTINNRALTHSGGALAGHTGSPGDGANCTSCHSGTVFPPQPGWITSNVPSGGYIPGTTYTITATATHNTSNEFGFQVSPQNTAGTALGTLIATNTTETQLTGLGAYITHTSSGIAGTSNARTWTFDWTAPIAGTGAVTFYGAFNATNNSNTNAGDEIYTSTLTVQEDITISVAGELSDNGKLNLFPNPVSSHFTFNAALAPGQSTLEIMSLDGRTVKAIQLENLHNSQIDVNDLNAGIYFVTIKTGNNSYTEKIIKE